MVSRAVPAVVAFLLASACAVPPAPRRPDPHRATEVFGPGFVAPIPASWERYDPANDHDRARRERLGALLDANTRVLVRSGRTTNELIVLIVHPSVMAVPEDDADCARYAALGSHPHAFGGRGVKLVEPRRDVVAAGPACTFGVTGATVGAAAFLPMPDGESTLVVGALGRDAGVVKPWESVMLGLAWR
jgi:hypothetical protein